MLVVYLSNRYIRVVEGDSSGGKINARAMYYAVDNAGCILNGTIMDEEGLARIIHDLWEENHLAKKGIHLVIDSNQFTSKILDAPMLKNKQMMDYIEREFADVERIVNPAYSYFQLTNRMEDKTKMQTLFATMVSKDYIGQYLAMFEKLGMSIESVECAMGVALRLVGTLSQRKDFTGIVQFIDDMMLISVLMINGRYNYFSRNRLFSDQGTPDFAVELTRSVSNILQFVKAQNIPEPIERVYVAGLNNSMLELYADSMQRMDSDIQVVLLEAGKYITFGKTLTGEGHPSNFAVPIGALIPTDSKTNLMAQMLSNPEEEEKKRNRKKVLIPVCVAGGIMILAAAGLAGYNLYLSRQLEQANAYNRRADVVEANDEYDALSRDISTVNVISNSMAALKSSTLTYPKVDSTTESTVAACASGLVTAEIDSYDSTTGVLTFDASADNAEQIHQFVDSLGEQAIFASVDYTGYTQDSEGQWNVEVNCTMADRQEDEDDTETN